MHIFKEKENEYIKLVNKKIVDNLKNSGFIKKNDSVLDFGCGTGIWESSKKGEDMFFCELYLFDINPKNREYCNKKYPKHVVLDELKQDLKVNVIFVNSIIQYIEKKELKKLLIKFHSILKKDGIIIISDIPKYSRVIEFILTFFVDFKLFKIQTKQALNSNYRKTEFFKHSIKELISISNGNFQSKIFQNMDNNTNRISLILKTKNDES
jgi:ubiquinone/menaquinone biosynthesis C-methylase UbiE